MAIKTQDYSLDSCKIVTSNGQVTEFRFILQDINIYEDIYSNYITGDLKINDSVGYLSQLGFNGHEFLILQFSQPNIPDCQSISRSFRIYKVSDRHLFRDQNEGYTIHFCSEEALLSEQYKISKSYKSKLVSDIAQDVLKTGLKLNSNALATVNIETTKGLRDIIIPNMKPFETLNWLCTQALSATNVGADYLFYENYFGYNFATLQSLYSANVPQNLKFKYEPKNIQQTNSTAASENMINVFAFEVVNNFDTIYTNSSGALANRLIAVDILRQNYTITDFDYSKYFASAKKLNPNGILSNYQNRFGDTDNKVFNSTLKSVTTNTGESTYNQYIKAHDPTIKDINIETTVPYRTAQISQINYIRYKLSVPGNPTLTVGKVIEFNLPEMTRTTDGKNADKYYSGKYLITSIKHKIDIENRFVTLMEISKESLPNPYDGVNNASSAQLNQVAK